METKFDFDKIGQEIVYVKSVDVIDLPIALREQVGDLEEVFAVHNASGEQLALVADRKLAFHLAREHDKQPVALQ